VRVAVLAVALAAALVLPATAGASQVTAGELRRLAAAGDAAGLRAVTSVDGRPVDIDAALAGARGDELKARIATLEGSIAGGRGASGDPRGDARDVLSQRRFHDTKVPGPFRGVLRRLGKLVPDLDWLDDLIPGSRKVMWVVLFALFAGLAWIVARRVMTRRIRASADEAAAEAAARGEDPKALERRAAEAEAAGDLEAALRLRFRAGLLRLDARGAIDFRPSISTYEVRRTLRSPDFDGLAATFDDVVYGGREPERVDVAAAREHWPEVVSSAPKEHA
jgi:hypothetical protein